MEQQPSEPKGQGGSGTVINIVLDLENEVCPTDSLSFSLLVVGRERDTYRCVSANC